MKGALAIVTILSLPLFGESTFLQGRASQSDSARLNILESESSASTMEALRRVEAEDVRFWNSEYSALETELLQLASAVNVPNTTAPNTTAKGEKAEDHDDLMKSMNLNPKSAMELAPALAMLKGLYEDSKDRIAQLNQREKESKVKFDVKVKAHEAKLATIESKFANHTLSLEFRTNETRDENRFWSYWSRCRERQHRQFHTGLKIQHATLSKVKKMMDMYEKAMSPSVDVQKQAKKEFTKVAAPEIVFLEERRSVVVFCKEAIGELRAARDELSQSSLPTTA